MTLRSVAFCDQCEQANMSKPTQEACINLLEILQDNLCNISPDELTPFEGQSLQQINLLLRDKDEDEAKVMSNYVVFEDGETWISEHGAYVVPRQFLTPQDVEDLEAGDKVLKSKIPRISVAAMISAMESTGIWKDLVKELKSK